MTWTEERKVMRFDLFKYSAFWQIESHSPAYSYREGSFIEIPALHQGQFTVEVGTWSIKDLMGMTMLRCGCSVAVMVVVMRMAVRVIVVVGMGHNVVVLFSNSWGCNPDTRDTGGKLSRLGSLAGNNSEDLESKLNQEIWSNTKCKV